MFIGRERELGSLNKHYQRGGFGFFCIYGRRRVGKTELIKEFIKDKKAIYFTGREDTKHVNLAAFSAEVREILYNAKGQAVYDSFEDAFSDVYAFAKLNKLVLVIDEYPYLAKSYPGISSLLQVQIDHRLKDTDIFIILCGSSMSFMENQVMGHESPLYGRRTGQIKVTPFDFETSKKFCPHRSDTEKAVVYGITGGMAKYLRLFSTENSLDDEIINNFFNSDELLFEEPANLLKQELREPNLYNAIISAAAAGKTRINEIATKTGLDTSICVKYLKNLSELGIVKREIPVFEKENSKKSLYRLDDGMFRFWYRFVYANLSKIQLGLGAGVFEEIRPQISGFMGEVFEQICKEYMWKAQLPFSVSAVGRWWGNNPLTRSEQEIDLVAHNAEKTKAIFCECKWTNEKVTEGLVLRLIEKAEMFNFDEKYYFIFSKSGFSRSAVGMAGRHIVLVDYAEM